MKGDREPFDPPYYREDLPQLDLLHSQYGVGAEWMESERRKEIAVTRRRLPDRIYCEGLACDAYLAQDKWPWIHQFRWVFKNNKWYCREHIPAFIQGRRIEMAKQRRQHQERG